MASTDRKAQQDGGGELPVVVAGGGCVGLFVALLLCRSEIKNRVVVIEPNAPSPYDTKAIAHQPLIFPLFAQADLVPELSQLGSFADGLCFRTSVANGSKVIAEKQFKQGEMAQLLLPQHEFQALLMQKVRDAQNGTVLLGSKIVGFEDNTTSVSVKIEDADGKEEAIEAAYLIGADGAKSTVRKLLGIELQGETLDVQLVATDIFFDFHRHGFFDGNFIIDPDNYGLIGRIDNAGLWRVSYGVPGHTSDEDIHAGVHDKLEKMLPDGGRNEAGERAYQVKRIAPYKAQQRAAGEFWRGRVGLAGDAAHLTNPYAGLGLASGIADASSLAIVLVRILTSQSSDPAKLLNSWAVARKQKFLTVVDKPSRAAYARVTSKVDTQDDIDRLLERDVLVGALKKGMPMMPPSLVTIGEELEGW